MKVTRAISIRQPYVEQIFRGTKTNEFRSMPTNIRERVWVYSSLRPADDAGAWRKVGKKPGDLPAGVIVGSVEIIGCREWKNCFAYQLKRPKRLSRFRRAANQPQPVFWKPQFR